MLPGCARETPVEEPNFDNEAAGMDTPKATVTEYVDDDAPTKAKSTRTVEVEGDSDDDDAEDTVCGTATSNFSNRTYDIIAIEGPPRCNEAMAVVNDFFSGNTNAIKDGDESWQAINGWRCGRGVNVGRVEPGSYTMNCWDDRTRVVFVDVHD